MEWFSTKQISYSKPIMMRRKKVTITSLQLLSTQFSVPGLQDFHGATEGSLAP
ncbi:unnamed protein product [Linum tenue]|uniref:Uncharacterized protein n=1 Tax=Linum tenue TaxID=586396 RepID=A0AAV0GZX6_9ROSI|nr:unnamed protein product [Linum tenue]